MIEYLRNFSDSAKELSRNPLGIIALFIVLVYGFACLLFGFSAEHLNLAERAPLIWFTILFPVLVLFIFFWLVTRHHKKLYSPRDFRDDESFLSAMRDNQKNPIKTQESESDIKDLIAYAEGFEVIKEREKKITNDLKNRKCNFSDSKTVEVLIHQLAASQVLNWFEKIYNTLFGSQIKLLKILNAHTLGTSLSIISQFFDRVKSQYPKELGTWDVKSYLSFLITSQLIIEKEGKIFISKLGREFLVWLTKSGYSESKVL